jgi:transposase
MEARAGRALATAGTIRELRAAQSIVLPATLGITLEQTAVMLGISRASVARLQKRFRESSTEHPRADSAKKATWGGRRRALMSYQEEQDFLAPWVERAEGGGILVVSPLRAALAQKLGRKVAATIVYRMLARHGWRKVAPDTRHPKSDPQVQEAWKKNSRKRWLPC